MRVERQMSARRSPGVFPSVICNFGSHSYVCREGNFNPKENC